MTSPTAAPRDTAAVAVAGDAEPPRTRPATNALYLVVANLGSRLLTLVLFLYTTRTLKSPLFGGYNQVTTAVALLSFISDLGLNMVATRAVTQDRTQAVRYVSNTLALRVVFSIVDIALVVALAQHLIQSSLRAALYVYALSLLPLALSSTLQIVFQFTERMAYPAALNVATTALRVALSLFVLATGHHVLGLVAVFTVVSFAGAAATAWIVYTRFLPLRLAVDPSSWPALLREAAPFAVLFLLSYFYGRVDMQILSNLKGCPHNNGPTCPVLGQYGAAYQGLDVLTAVFVSTTAAALFPAINRVASESHAALARVVRASYVLLLALGVGVALFVTFFAPEAMRILGGGDKNGYGPAAPALAILIWDLPCYLIVNILGTALVAVHRQKTMILAFGVTLVFNVVLNILLIPRYSYYASSVLTVVSEMVNGAILLATLRAAIGPLRLAKPSARVGSVAVVTALALWALRPAGVAVSLPVGVIVALLGVRLARVLGDTEREVLGRLPVVGRFARLF